jgi:hypothetical protein
MQANQGPPFEGPKPEKRVRASLALCVHMCRLGFALLRARRAAKMFQNPVLL